MKKVATGITLDQKVYDKTKAGAQADGRSFSGFLNILLRDRHQKGSTLDIKETAKAIQSYCMRNKMPKIDDLEKILRETL